MPSIGSIALPWPLIRTFTTAIAVLIRMFDCTLVDKHVHSREGVLGSNPTSPEFLRHIFATRWQLLRNASSKEHHTRYITLFFEGTYSVIRFFEVLRMSYVGLRDFMR